MLVLFCTSVSNSVLLVYRVHHIRKPDYSLVHCNPDKLFIAFVGLTNIPTLIYCATYTMGTVIGLGATLECLLVVLSIGVMNQ
jgi:hypothetical protein